MLLLAVTSASGVVQTPARSPAPASTSLTGRVVPTVKDVRSAALDPWRDFESLRGRLDREGYQAFFSSRPQQIAARLLEVASTLRTAKAEWEAADDGLKDGEKSDEVRAPPARLASALSASFSSSCAHDRRRWIPGSRSRSLARLLVRLLQSGPFS